MSTADIEALKKACAEGGPRSASQQLNEGETSWFAGRPAWSSDGTVSLALSETVSLTLQDGDILDVVKIEDTYLVKTSVDANVLFRQQVVLKADPARGGDCDCASEETDIDDGTAARQPLPPWIPRVPEIPDFFWDWNNPGYCFSDCQLRFRCVKAPLPDGNVYRICFPVWNCVTRCPPGPRPA